MAAAIVTALQRAPGGSIFNIVDAPMRQGDYLLDLQWHQHGVGQQCQPRGRWYVGNRTYTTHGRTDPLLHMPAPIPLRHAGTTGNIDNSTSAGREPAGREHSVGGSMSKRYARAGARPARYTRLRRREKPSSEGFLPSISPLIRPPSSLRTWASPLLTLCRRIRLRNCSNGAGRCSRQNWTPHTPSPRHLAVPCGAQCSPPHE